MAKDFFFDFYNRQMELFNQLMKDYNLDEKVAEVKDSLKDAIDNTSSYLHTLKESYLNDELAKKEEKEYVNGECTKCETVCNTFPEGWLDKYADRLEDWIKCGGSGLCLDDLKKEDKDVCPCCGEKKCTCSETDNRDIVIETTDGLMDYEIDERDVEQDIIDLEDEIDDLKNEIDDLKEENSILTINNEHLIQENERLTERLDKIISTLKSID